VHDDARPGVNALGSFWLKITDCGPDASFEAKEKGYDRMSACVDIRFLFESTCLNLGETCASNFGHWIAVGR
jgi:hypothetical protein